MEGEHRGGGWLSHTFSQAPREHQGPCPHLLLHLPHSDTPRRVICFLWREQHRRSPADPTESHPRAAPSPGKTPNGCAWRDTGKPRHETRTEKKMTPDCRQAAPGPWTARAGVMSKHKPSSYQSGVLGGWHSRSTATGTAAGISGI